MPRMRIPDFAAFAGGSAVLCGGRPAAMLGAAVAVLILAGNAHGMGSTLRVSAPSGHSLLDASFPGSPVLDPIVTGSTVAPVFTPAPSDEIVAIAAWTVSEAMGSDEAGDAFVSTYEAMAERCLSGAVATEGCVLRAPGVVFDFGSGSYVVGRGDGPSPDEMAGVGRIVAEDVAGGFVLRDPVWVEAHSGEDSETYAADQTTF